MIFMPFKRPLSLSVLSVSVTLLLNRPRHVRGQVNCAACDCRDTNASLFCATKLASSQIESIDHHLRCRPCC
ncbi:hypothetical protein QBC39DRAFT_6574 [Podospora conica]|nr:hypothetical protein QBC39DRAFT_6574 [Schizothecium conicum]